MKIVFDNEMQMNVFFNILGGCDSCPERLGLPEGRCRGVECSECWRDAIEIEVKNDKPRTDG